MLRKKNAGPMKFTRDQFTFVCQKCGKTATHEVTFVRDPVHHLRCLTCRCVQACLLEDTLSDEVLNAKALDLEALQDQPGRKHLHLYRSRDRFADGEFIKHPTFGEGYVLAVDQPPVKMTVLFADQSRLLVCGTLPGTDAGTTGEQTGEASLFEVAPIPDADIPVLADHQGDPEGEQATCPKCGRIVHPYNLSRTEDGKSTVGCTFCVLD